METALSYFNENLPKNRKVSLRLHEKNLIKVSPLESQPEPPFLQNFKAEMTAQWPMTSLLEIVKKTDFQIGFTDQLRGLGDREILATTSVAVPVGVKKAVWIFNSL